MSHEVHLRVLPIRRDGETYVVVWQPGREGEVLRQLGRWASSKELSFGWSEAGWAAAQVLKELVKEPVR